MDVYMQLIMNSMQIAAAYILFSLGLTLIFGVMRIVNFAHGEFFTLPLLVMGVTVPSWPAEPCRFLHRMRWAACWGLRSRCC